MGSTQAFGGALLSFPEKGPSRQAAARREGRPLGQASPGPLSEQARQRERDGGCPHCGPCTEYPRKPHEPWGVLWAGGHDLPLKPEEGGREIRARALLRAHTLCKQAIERKSESRASRARERGE